MSSYKMLQPNLFIGSYGGVILGFFSTEFTSEGSQTSVCPNAGITFGSAFPSAGATLRVYG